MAVDLKSRRTGIIGAIGPEPTNGGVEDILLEAPYRVEVSIEGTAPILFHAWNVESVAAKAAAKKGSKAKKTDNVESYVYRNDKGDICLPGEYLRQAIIAAAKYQQDPRSPRKSAADLYKAGIVSLTDMASFGKDKWDYEDKRRVTVQRNGVTRVRPALRLGWKATFIIQVLTPEYISSQALLEVITAAGRLIGVGDFRPTFGRFVVTSFVVLPE
jgi:hypothetical protein